MFLLPYLIIVVGLWAFILCGGIIGNIIRAKNGHKQIRKTDLCHLLLSIFISNSSFFVYYNYSEIISNFPSGLTTFGIGMVIVLVYLTEKHTKDWSKLCKRIKTHKTNTIST